MAGMGLTAEEILEHARALPPQERLKLVERVVHSLVEQDEQGAHDAAAMDRELERRIERAQTGQTIAAEDVMAALRARG
jgi:putative addiction module component (TIGR02574 family)